MQYPSNISAKLKFFVPGKLSPSSHGSFTRAKMYSDMSTSVSSIAADMISVYVVSIKIYPWQQKRNLYKTHLVFVMHAQDNPS